MSASQDYSELVRRFYDAAIDDEAWAGAVGELKTRLNLTRVALGWFRSAPPPGELATQLLHSDCDLYFERLFAELGSANLFIPRMGLTRPGDLLSDRMLMRRDEFVRTTLFNEWFAPQDDHSAALINIESGSTAQAFLVAQRGGRQPQFTPRDEADMLALTPALMHAFAIRRRLGTERLHGRGLAYERLGIGFAVTDANGRLLFCNGLAERYFSADQGLLLSRRRVITAQRTSLSHLIAAACAPSGFMPGGSVIVTHGEAATPTFAVSVSPVRDERSEFELPGPRGAMLLIQPLASRLPDAFESRVQALFGLTAKEASLATALSAGLSLGQAAEERFISLATARTQLASIFRKTGTAQQSQLVALLLRAVPVTP